MRGTLLVLLPLLMAGCAGVAAPEPSPVVPDAGWSGEIVIGFTGCTSCADCRAAIRQISQSQSGSDHVEFHAGVARITYPSPATMKPGEVARALSGPGVIKGQVDRVTLKTEGRIRLVPGGREFAVLSTGQAWRVAEGSVDVPPDRPVSIEAVLEGWRESETPALRILSARPL